MWSLVEFFPDLPIVDVLDVGAALHERPAYQSLVEARRARIVGFEPDPDECERLNRTYGMPHRFFPHFVGDGAAATFHETNWTLTGSLYPPNSALLGKFQNLAEVVVPVATHPVKTVRLDDVEGIGNVDLFKIDVQGGELNVFRHAERVLSQTLVVWTEVEFVELYRGQPLFADVDTFLRRQGFQFHAFHGICGRAFKPLVVGGDANMPLRQSLWSDVIYVRDWMHLEVLEPEVLAKYAVLAHDVLQSYDLAHLVLQALDGREPGSARAGRYLEQLTRTPEPASA